MAARKKDPRTAAPTPAGARARLTLADVAQMAGVDRAIVSRVLSEDPTLRIRDETRRRVLDVVARVGYRPNHLARSLSNRKAGVVALLVPELEDPTWAAIVAGAEAEAAERGMLIMVARTSEPGGADAHLERIGPGRVDGIVLAGSDISAATERWVATAGIALLRLNRRGRTAPRRYLVPDNAQVAGVAVDHLVALGHRRIAFLGGPAGDDFAKRRLEGFRRALRKAGADAGAAPCEEVDLTPEAGAAGLLRLLAARERPTAVVVAQVPATFGALRAAAAAGIAVPGDLSVVAVSDQPLLGFALPRLTAVRPPLEQLGRRAVELLTTVPPDQAITEVLSAPMELIDRGSTAPARARRGGLRSRLHA